jgi:hypothetical protein
MALVARLVQDLAKQQEQRDLTSHYNGLLQISHSERKKLEGGPPTVPTGLPGVLDVLEKCTDYHGHCWGNCNGIAGTSRQSDTTCDGCNLALQTSPSLPLNGHRSSYGHWLTPSRTTTT